VAVVVLIVVDVVLVVVVVDVVVASWLFTKAKKISSNNTMFVFKYIFF
jgi:hypothetical protein